MAEDLEPDDEKSEEIDVLDMFLDREYWKQIIDGWEKGASGAE
jgi:hypothetical protein